MENELMKNLQELEQKEAAAKESQIALEKAKADTSDYEAKAAAMKQELDRVQEQLAKAREEKRKASEKDVSFQEKFQSEQRLKASEKFFKDFGYDKPELQKEFLDKFKGTTAIDADNIYKDMVRTHLWNNPDKYVNLEKEASTLRANASELEKQLSSSANYGMGGLPAESSAELTKEDEWAARWAGLSIERYRELKQKGKIQ